MHCIFLVNAHVVTINLPYMAFVTHPNNIDIRFRNNLGFYPCHQVRERWKCVKFTNKGSIYVYNWVQNTCLMGKQKCFYENFG